MSEPVARPSLRDRHKQLTRATLLTAAISLFADRSYDDVTVDEICAAADVSPRTFFRYFGSKEALLSMPFLDLADRLVEALNRTSPARTPWAALTEAAFTAFAVIDREPQQYLAIWKVTNAARELLSANGGFLLDKEQDISQAMTRRVAAAHPRQARPDLPARLLTGMAIVALRVALDEWAATDGREPFRRSLDAQFTALDRGPTGLVAGPRSGPVSRSRTPAD